MHLLCRTAFMASLTLLACDNKSSRATPATVETATAAAEPVPTVAAAPSATASAAPAAARFEVTLGRLTSDVVVPDAALVVGSFRDDFAACYEKEPNPNPGVTGRVELVFVVEPMGSMVGLPRGERPVGVPASVVECLVKKSSSARFPGFAGHRATIRVPLAFAPNTKK